MKPLINIIIILSVGLVQLLLCNFIHAGQIHPVFNKLSNRLEMDGMKKKYLQNVFTHPELELMYKVIALSLIRKEAKLNYAQFLTKDSVSKAVSYLKTHDTTLEKTECDFGVSAPVVVAILSIETACGTYTGSINTVNILATQAVSLETEIYQQIVNQIPLKEKLTLTSSEIKTVLKKRVPGPTEN